MAKCSNSNAVFARTLLLALLTFPSHQCSALSPEAVVTEKETTITIGNKVVEQPNDHDSIVTSSRRRVRGRKGKTNQGGEESSTNNSSSSSLQMSEFLDANGTDDQEDTTISSSTHFLLRGLQSRQTCNNYCQTDSDCALSSDGCNFCASGNTCQNSFASGVSTQGGWDGVSCINNYSWLQTALNYSGASTITLCANSFIPVTGNNILTSNRNSIFIRCGLYGENNCRIRRTSGTGRLMTFFGGNIRLRGITFENGRVIGGGGALYIQGPNNTIEQCTFINNRATNGNGGAASIGGRSSAIISIQGNNNVAIGTGTCNGIYDRSTNQCFMSPADAAAVEQDRNFGTFGNTGGQCNIGCFSDSNCQSMSGRCTSCNAVTGQCYDPNPNDNRNNLLPQCGQTCNSNYDCSVQYGGCTTCDTLLRQCYDPTGQWLFEGNRFASSRTCVSNEAMLRTALLDKSSVNTIVEICSNTNIVLTSEISSNVSGKTLRCQGGARTCTISRDTTRPNFRLMTLGGNNIEIMGITFTGGRAYYSSGNRSGGALLLLGTQTNISNCFFSNNRAGDRGGAISMRSGTILNTQSGYGNFAPQCSTVYYSSTGLCGTL